MVSLDIEVNWYRKLAKTMLTVVMAVCVVFFVLDIIIGESGFLADVEGVQVIGGLIYVILIPIGLILLVFASILAVKLVQLNLGKNDYMATLSDEGVVFKSPLDVKKVNVSLSSIEHVTVELVDTHVKIRVKERKTGIRAFLHSGGIEEHLLIVSKANYSKATSFFGKNLLESSVTAINHRRKAS